MLFNVSTLLREPVGSTRRIAVDAERVVVPDAGYERAASGEVLLLRSERGVLVSARIEIVLPFECARCTVDFEAPVAIAFDEEFVAPDDPHATARGRAIDPDDFLVDEHHHLDLSEAIRQYEQSALPLVPLCRPDCAGLCPECGQDRNEARCGCDAARGSDAWSPLAALADQLRRTEDGHGTSEA